MVGDDHSVRTCRDHRTGVIDGLDSFDHQWALPHGPQPRQVRHRRARVEHLRDQLGDRALETVQ